VPGSTGSGVLGTITFKIITAPPTAKSVSCDLKINNIILLDPAGNTITTYDVVHGYYEYAAPKPPLPYLKVVPDYVSAKAVGDQVVVNVTIQDLVAVWRAVGFQWRLTFDPTILGYVNATEGDFLKEIAKKAGPNYGTFFYAINESNYVISFSLYYEVDGKWEVFPEGSGTLGTLTFNAIKFGSCNLTLSEIMIIDADGNSVETRPPQHGFFSISPPWLSVYPKEKTATALSEEFDINVLINELGKDWRLVGAEFQIRYNSTLLDLVNITEGGFMKHFADLSGTDTWFQYYVEQDPVSKYGIVGIMILPLPNGTWLGPFPDTKDYGAPGDLALIKFRAIYQHDTLDVTDERAIWLNGIILANTAGQEIPYNKTRTAIEGKCEYTIKRAVPPWPPTPPIEYRHPEYPYSIDLFTQYGWPYGGVGYNRVSDAFPPQALVNLFAYASYYDDAVVGKPVSFELAGPDGTRYTTSILTDEFGVATLTYVLPWDVEGVWNVKATIALGGKQISDYSSFREDWLIKAFIVDIEGMKSKTIIKQAEVYRGSSANYSDKKYFKGEELTIAVNLQVITMQNPKVCMEKIYGYADMYLDVTIFDDLKQPVASARFIIDELIEDADYENTVDFVRTIEGLISFSATIKPNAFSGPAHVYFNIFTNEPGVPYCPQTEVLIWMRKGT
jgi:hypothetical protein